MATKIGLFTVLFTAMALQARAQQLPWTIIINGNLTTSSQLYVDPNNPDPVSRSQYTNLTNFFGYGVEVKYQLPDTHVAFGISVDYSRARVELPLSGSLLLNIPVDDGYKALALECTGYFIIPFSGSSIGVFMGGGVGGYFGTRANSIGGVTAPLVASTPGFGIHVLAGVSYRFWDRISVVGEMKFRDLQFSSTNQFQKTRIVYQGTEFTTSLAPFDSNVHTDGITFQIGLGFSM